MPAKKIYDIVLFFVAFSIISLLLVYYQSKNDNLLFNLTESRQKNIHLNQSLQKVKTELLLLQNQDQFKINKNLQQEIDNIQKTYNEAVSTYEKLLDLKAVAKPSSELDTLFTKSLVLLSQKKYASASANLKTLNGLIQKEKDKLATSFSIPANVPLDNKPPVSGYKRQQVQVDGQTFLVDIISADLNSTRVIVDTASDGDCRDNCPVLSLADYVSRSGAYAGVNGSYFCPSTYPSCSDKKNSFDTLLMNKNKVYFNSDNNVYSTIPAIIVSGTSVRFVNQSLEWGRDTGVDAVIANYPLLVTDGNVAVSQSSDGKLTSKGARSFIGSSGATIYIGVVFNSTVRESATVLKTLGLSYALNLDDGGSTALWFNGYKAGPGRALPNAILFVRK